MNEIMLKKFNAEEYGKQYEEKLRNKYNEDIEYTKSDLRKHNVGITVTFCLGLLFALIAIISAINCFKENILGFWFYVALFSTMFALVFLSASIILIFDDREIRSYENAFLKKFKNNLDEYESVVYCNDNFFEYLLKNCFVNNNYKLLNIKLEPNKNYDNELYMIFEFEDDSRVKSYKESFKIEIRTDALYSSINLLNKTICVPYGTNCENIFSANIIF